VLSAVVVVVVHVPDIQAEQDVLEADIVDNLMESLVYKLLREVVAGLRLT
jgi:hypothetical protein